MERRRYKTVTPPSQTGWKAPAQQLSESPQELLLNRQLVPRTAMSGAEVRVHVDQTDERFHRYQQTCKEGRGMEEAGGKQQMAT
ncbi:hypothetical protein EYF80_005640 [Liparis tanakae]|uniref:Uncharacterized protein n=1 Tax=Liparis tanakae TaxID=230148 RepID=A0A4Z2J2G4_9TELE|nr:hypothetical protein EYF80_005640 [Liparis tanakae]